MATSRLNGSHFGPSTLGREYWDYWDYPSTIHNQKFGSPIDESKFRTFGMSPSARDFMSRTSSETLRKETGSSSVKNDPGCFQVLLDVSQFKIDEVDVKTVGNEVVIHAKHFERQDEHGSVSREFTRKYLLPLGTDPEKVTAVCDSNGILLVKAVKDLPASNVTNGKETYIRMEKSTETKTTTTSKQTNGFSKRPASSSSNHSSNGRKLLSTDV